ncbi:hypothetical protein [Brevundimonas sp.]|jgi:hypothetical protein|uniref:hypothetical protein n=1 Tax=Brevundimonas sp. TaxID=1871086 RepID=UPI003783E1A8
MTHYSVADAQAQLPRLLEAARRGEDVYIAQTNPDAAIKLVWTPLEPRAVWDMEWLDAHRVRPRRGRISTARAINEMKDENPR